MYAGCAARIVLIMQLSKECSAMALLLAAFAAFLTVCTASNETEVLDLILISSGGGQYNSSGIEPAVDLAVQIINDNQIIPGYRLNVASRGDSNVSFDFKLILIHVLIISK